LQSIYPQQEPNADQKSPLEQPVIRRNGREVMVGNAILVKKEAAAILKVLQLPFSDFIAINAGLRNHLVSFLDTTDKDHLAKVIEQAFRDDDAVYLLRVDGGGLMIDGGEERAAELTRIVSEGMKPPATAIPSAPMTEGS
jgi:hypothetical protein